MSTTTKPRLRRYEDRMPPLHPGEMLREEFLVPMGLSANALALALSVPATRISEIVNERRGITGDTALRLGRYFGMTPEFWMNLQSTYDLETARELSEKHVQQNVRPAPRDKKTGLLKVNVLKVAKRA
ncbi:MAG TPA: HigA family addiction module antitoxin [Acidobacteriaceae bacterium]